MKKFFLTLLAIVSVTMAWAQNPAAYMLYDKDGNRVDYCEMIQQMSVNDLVFIGEIHNCAMAHWMEKLIVQDLYAIHGEQFMLGAEMFERDDQLLLNEYLEGIIPFSRLKAEAKLWDNYETDYAPIVEFAKEHKVPFIATNVARRYANMVSKEDFKALDKISEEAKQWIAPLPINYIDNPLVNEYFKKSLPPMMKNVPTTKLAHAQAVKDATMAWSISQTLKGKMVHINGSFHSTGHAGIISYLDRYRPALKIGTIEIIHQEKVDTLADEYKGNADYFICVPSSMATTF